MTNKTIVTTTILFLFISFIFLSVVEKRSSDINSQNIWMLYFDDPRSNSLDFKIENHSTSNSFHWKVISNKNTIKEGDENIPLGETKNIPIALEAAEANEGKITISVSDTNKNIKEIYKDFR